MSQQFVVPQFIEIEDKVLGPLTVRQFIILLIAGIINVISFRYGDFAMKILVLILVGGGAVVSAFLKINGQSFHYFLLNFLQTSRKPGLRLWHKSYSNEELKNFINKPAYKEEVPVQKAKALPRRHIEQLSLVVNTGGFYAGEDGDNLL